MHEKKVSITMTLRDKATARVKKLRSMLSLAGTTGKKAFRSVSTGAHIANAALQQAKVRTSLLTGAFARMRLMSAGAFAKIATMSKSVFGGMLNIVKGAFGRITALVGRMVHKVLNGIKLLSLAFVGLSVASVKMAADVGESENLFEVSMGAMAKSTREWSDQVATQLHLNAYAIRRYVGTFNVMLKSMGIGTQEAASMSKAMTQLSMDISSFYNVGLDEAMQKIQSGITGEAEPLKRLGILVNETTVKTWALNHGLIAQKQELSEVQKVLGRYGVIMEATNAAQGDMARTANSPQNIFKAIGAQLKILMIKWGEGFLPMVERTGIKLRTFFEDSRNTVAKWSITMSEKVDAAADIIGAFFSAGDNWHQRWRALWDGMLEIMKGATKVAVTLAIAAGKGIWKGIMNPQKGASAEYEKAGGKLLSSGDVFKEATGKRILSSKKRRQYMEENFNQVGGHEFIGTAKYVRKSDAEKWAEAQARAQEKRLDALLGPAFAAANKIMDKTFAKAGSEVGKLSGGGLGKFATARLQYADENAQRRIALLGEKRSNTEKSIKTSMEAQVKATKELLRLESISASSEGKFALMSKLQQAQALTLMKQLRAGGVGGIGRLTISQKEMIGRVDLLREYAEPALQKYTRELEKSVMSKSEQADESAATKASSKLTEAGSVLLQAGKALLRSAGQGNALAREANAARVGVGVG